MTKNPWIKLCHYHTRPIKTGRQWARENLKDGKVTYADLAPYGTKRECLAKIMEDQAYLRAFACPICCADTTGE